MERLRLRHLRHHNKITHTDGCSKERDRLHTNLMDTTPDHNLSETDHQEWQGALDPNFCSECRALGLSRGRYSKAELAVISSARERFQSLLRLVEEQTRARQKARC